MNEAGSLYEALTRGERADSPHRKRQMYSPTKRQTPSKRCWYNISKYDFKILSLRIDYRTSCQMTAQKN